eukprot:2573342-Prymnesium_polylepis.1
MGGCGVSARVACAQRQLRVRRSRRRRPREPREERVCVERSNECSRIVLPLRVTIIALGALPSYTMSQYLFDVGTVHTPDTRRSPDRETEYSERALSSASTDVVQP